MDASANHPPSTPKGSAAELPALPFWESAGQTEIPLAVGPITVQPELPLTPPPPPTPEEQIAGFTAAHEGIPESQFSNRNRMILVLASINAKNAAARAAKKAELKASFLAAVKAAGSEEEASRRRAAYRAAMEAAAEAERTTREAELTDMGRHARASRAAIRWVLMIARRRAYDRLVQKAKAGRRGKREQILAALREGAKPEEIERQFKIHRTTVLRARLQLQHHRTAA